MEIVGVAVWYDGVFFLEDAAGFRAVLTVLDRVSNHWNNARQWKECSLFYNLNSKHHSFPPADIQNVNSLNENSIRAHGGRNFWGEELLSVTLLISSQNAVTFLHLPPRFPWLSWPLGRGFLFLWASRHYVLSVHSPRGREERVGGSLQEELKSDSCKKNLCPPFLSLPVARHHNALLSSCRKTPWKERLPGHVWLRTSSVERVWLDIPFSDTPWASQMLKQLKYVMLFLLWLSRGLEPRGAKTNTMGIPSGIVSIESSSLHVTHVQGPGSPAVMSVKHGSYGKWLLVTVFRAFRSTARSLCTSFKTDPADVYWSILLPSILFPNANRYTDELCKGPFRCVARLKVYFHQTTVHIFVVQVFLFTNQGASIFLGCPDFHIFMYLNQQQTVLWSCACTDLYVCVVCVTRLTLTLDSQPLQEAWVVLRLSSQVGQRWWWARFPTRLSLKGKEEKKQKNIKHLFSVWCSRWRLLLCFHWFGRWCFYFFG